MTPPVFTTDRLTMRAPTQEDRVAYGAFYAASDLTVGHYRGGRSDSEVDALLEHDIANWVNKGFGIWILSKHGDDKILGGTGFDFADDWQMHELTWWLMPEARGLGYVTEAARVAIDWAYENALWPQVETYFRDENTASRRVAERLGGTFDRRQTFPDGVTRDIYALPKQVIV